MAHNNTLVVEIDPRLTKESAQVMIDAIMLFALVDSVAWTDEVPKVYSKHIKFEKGLLGRKG